jgi:hypothetical protein
MGADASQLGELLVLAVVVLVAFRVLRPRPAAQARPVRRLPVSYGARGRFRLPWRLYVGAVVVVLALAYLDDLDFSAAGTGQAPPPAAPTSTVGVAP